MSEITKNQLKLIRSLNQKKNRREKGLFLVEGIKNIEELLASDWKIKNIYVTNSFKHDFIKGEFISEKELKQVTSLSNSEGLIAVVELPKLKKKRIDEELILILDSINDPGNFGTIIRTADWFGINHIICSPTTVDCFNPKVVQSTKGSLFHLHIDYLNLEDFLNDFEGDVYGASLDGDKLTNVKFNRLSSTKQALIMGSESHGISENLEKFLTQKIKIPNYGKAESLNVGVATGILLHHFTLKNN